MRKHNNLRSGVEVIQKNRKLEIDRIWIGIDLGDRVSQVCLLDDEGTVAGRAEVATTPEGMHKYFAGYAGARVAIEAGTHSPWVSRLLTSCGLTVTVANAREVRKIHESNRKNDRSDAEVLARMLRFDPKLLAPIRHRSAAMQADLSVIRARDAIVGARTKCINAVRGLVKSFGYRLPKCSAESFAVRAAASVPAELEPALSPLLDTIGKLTTQVREYDRRIDDISKGYPETVLLRQVTGVGPLSSLSFVLTVSSSDRFQRSRDIGSYLGLVPRQYDSGDQHSQLSITKAGNGFLRRLLVQNAQYILSKFGPDCRLKQYGARLMARGGKNARKRAVVAVARKLAILLHHLWATGAAYDPLYNNPPGQLAA